MRTLLRFIRLGGLASDIHGTYQVLYYLLSYGLSLGVVGALNELLEFVLQMSLLSRILLLIGGFLCTLAIFGLALSYPATRLSARQARSALDAQASTGPRTSSGTSIETQNIENLTAQGGVQHGGQHANSGASPESGEQEDEPSANSPQEPPPNPPEGASALYPPLGDHELAESHFEKRTIYIADFAWKVRALGWTNAVITNRTFENCRVYGPAVLTLLSRGRFGGHTFVDCRWAEGANAFWMASPEDHPGFVGVIGLKDCVFRACSFTQVGVLVHSGDYERYQERNGNDPTPQQ